MYITVWLYFQKYNTGMSNIAVWYGIVILADEAGDQHSRDVVTCVPNTASIVSSLRRRASASSAYLARPVSELLLD